MKSFWQFIKFGLVGLSNTLISEGVYALLVLLGANYLLANTVGFILSVLNAYFWSNRYVFKEDPDAEKRVWWKVLLKTYVAYIWGFLVNLFLLFMWVQLIGIAKYVGPVTDFCVSLGWKSATSDTVAKLLAEAINLIITIPMNFLINKFWAYRQKKKAE